jgi:hypothetical protein
MSKDKPEVGDVFEYNDFLYAIQEVSEKGVIYVQRPKEYFEPFISQTFRCGCKCFEKAKYLGKSKVNISDLFKTENE